MTPRKPKRLQAPEFVSTGYVYWNAPYWYGANGPSPVSDGCVPYCVRLNPKERRLELIPAGAVCVPVRTRSLKSPSRNAKRTR